MSIRGTGTPKHSTRHESVTSDTDWEVECDLTNSEYLCALVMQKITNGECAHKTAMLNEQLRIQKLLLRELGKQKKNAQEHLMDIQLQKQLQFCVHILNDIAEKFDDATTKQGFKSNIDFIHEKLSDAYNRIYLKNIEPLATQEDYECLINLIKKCDESIERTLGLTQNMKEVKKLADCLEMNKHLRESINDQLQNLHDLENETTYTLLKNASDKMAHD